MRKVSLIIIVFLVFFYGCSSPKVIEINESFDVDIQDYNGEFYNVYLSEEKQITTLENNVSFGQFYAVVADSTGCEIGDSLDFWDDTNYFQGIITDIDINNISFTSRTTDEFSSSNTIVKCGNWHLNVDGSTNKHTFYINPPTNVSWDVESLLISFTDNADHDSGTFGSRTALSNGFTGGRQNGVFNRFFLVTNNLGFVEQGFDYLEIEKSPSGQFGFITELIFEEKYGSIPELIGSRGDRIVINVNDDLTSQEHIGANLRIHYKTE